MPTSLTHWHRKNEKLKINNKNLESNKIPKTCPLLSQCRQTAVHKNIVKFIKARSPRILDCPEIWEQVSNCPHILEDAFYVGVIRDDDLLHYLKCEIFSEWFWNLSGKAVGTECTDKSFAKRVS